MQPHPILSLIHLRAHHLLRCVTLCAVALSVTASITAPLDAFADPAPKYCGVDLKPTATTLFCRSTKRADILTLKDLPPQITDVQINYMEAGGDLSLLGAHTQLIELALVGVPEGTDLSFISKLHNLKEAFISGSLPDILPLAALPSLTHLYLQDHLGLDITPLAASPSRASLSVLFLNGCGLKDLKPLAAFTALTELNISQSHLSAPAALAPISAATKLTTLFINESELTDLTPLTTLTALTKLSLDGNPLTDLTPLTALTALTELSLLGIPPTDLTPLCALKSLKSINLIRVEVTPAQLEALRACLPGAYIETEELSRGD